MSPPSIPGESGDRWCAMHAEVQISGWDEWGGL